MPTGAGQNRVATWITAWRPRPRGTVRRRRLRTGGLLDLDLGIGQEALVYMTGEWEPATVGYIVGQVQRGNVILDVGANIGLVAIPVALATRAAVHGFEPDPVNARRLHENLALNPDADVHVVEAAVSDEVGTVALGAGQGMLRRIESKPGDTPATTVDAYAADLLRVDLIKLDVEGHEPKALAGAHETLARWSPIVVCEVEDEHLRRCGSSARELLHAFAALGYGPAPMPGVGIQRLTRAHELDGNLTFTRRP
jgi:FkbM family methyltransferase